MRFISKVITGLALAFSLIGIETAKAEGTVVVELYTSQGCSSCPSADVILTQLRDNDRILPLSLNVDYWDYLGWKDDLALPGNAKRQRAYARYMNKRRVYTPQMIVDGKMDVVGSRAHEVDASVRAYLDQADSVQVSLVRNQEEQLQISADASPSDEMPIVTVWIVGYDSDVTVDVERGENGGRKLHYSNVVREWRKAADWDRSTDLDLQVEAPEGMGGAVAIIQVGKVGAILGAANLRYQDDTTLQ